MDQFRISQMALRVEHRHGDDWVRLEPTPEHNAVENDPERQWSRGRIFRCPRCQEEVRIEPEGGRDR